ncbi:MAG: cupredoxin domain-containing protein [Candidatus Limnocylindria bacterium]
MTLHRSLARLPVLLALTLVSAALGAAALAGPARAATHAIAISGSAFAPATLTINAGDTVTWTNADPLVHDAVSTSGPTAFDSGDLAQGESFSFTFTVAGTYDYHCTPHPDMVGRIVVQAAAPGPTTAPTAAPGGGGGTLPDVAMAPSEEPRPYLITGLALVALAAFVAASRRQSRRARSAPSAAPIRQPAEASRSSGEPYPGD